VCVCIYIYIYIYIDLGVYIYPSGCPVLRTGYGSENIAHCIIKCESNESETLLKRVLSRRTLQASQKKPLRIIQHQTELLLSHLEMKMSTVFMVVGFIYIHALGSVMRHKSKFKTLM
jgi:hypothetical protein